MRACLTTDPATPMSGNAILIVEDDREIREMLSFTLQRNGFRVFEADTVEAAATALEGPLPDLILVDWMLPGASGMDLVRKLRRDPHTADVPLMMLTAKGEEVDKLRSFEMGVDDYVTKPFSARELVARMRALLRRTGAPADGLLQAGALVLDTRSHSLSIGGNAVHIGPTEFRLLEFLLRNPGRAFDRTQLLDRVWGRGVYVEERTVDVHILRLRKILAPHAMEQLVQTVRGVGYRFASP